MLLINPTSNFQQDEEIEVDNKSVIYILIKCVQEKFELFINSNHVLLCTSSNVQYEQGVYDFIDIKSTSNIKNHCFILQEEMSNQKYKHFDGRIRVVFYKIKCVPS